MKKVRIVLSTAMLSIGAFSMMTLNSCSKDEVICNVGLEGDDCKTEVRQGYVGTYRGNGSSSIGETYSNWAAVISVSGNDIKNMILDMKDGNNGQFNYFNIILQTNTTFKIEPKTSTIDGETYNYEGYGTINKESITINLTETDSDDNSSKIIYTFSNMLKQ